ncbi:MAG: hypothetical protein M3Z23_06910 [Acidobacteriota bacterium]|nr:hypothetical protein [Acidobacteriota bacterium]
MLRFFQTSCFTLVFMSAGLATQPVGTVFGEGPLFMNGIQMDVAGVVAWTVLDGDEVSTTSSAAVILLPNRRGKIALRENTKLKFEFSRTKLLSGKAFFSLSGMQAMTVEALGRIVLLPSGERVAIEINPGGPVVRLGAQLPAFVLPADRLARRLPYDMGIIFDNHLIK